jgi:hypothetical protein
MPSPISASPIGTNKGQTLRGAEPAHSVIASAAAKASARPAISSCKLPKRGANRAAAALPSMYIAIGSKIMSP